MAATAITLEDWDTREVWLIEAEPGLGTDPVPRRERRVVGTDGSAVWAAGVAKPDAAAEFGSVAML